MTVTTISVIIQNNISIIKIFWYCLPWLISWACQTFGEAECILLLNPFHSLTALIIQQINATNKQIQQIQNTKIPNENPFSPDCDILKHKIAFISEGSKVDNGEIGKNDKIIDIIFCGINMTRKTFR